jgi:nitrogen-specific signal transduction histidine kinase
MQNADRLEEQIMMTESSQSNIETVKALQQAAAAAKATLKVNNIDNLDAVLDEIAEQNDQMTQIQEALAQSTVHGIDDDELQAELDVRTYLLKPFFLSFF